MRLEKTLVTSGDGTTFPNAGEDVEIEYTGWLYDSSKRDKRGQQIDTSDGRGRFVVTIGVGKVIRGWDILVCQMSLGETSTFTIPAALGYGREGFDSLIPSNSDLLFEVTLRRIIRR